MYLLTLAMLYFVCSAFLKRRTLLCPTVERLHCIAPATRQSCSISQKQFFEARHFYVPRLVLGFTIIAPPEMYNKEPYTRRLLHGPRRGGPGEAGGPGRGGLFVGC